MAREASAQVNMPDPSAIAGTPLPAPELPDRTVSVRVVRERMGNNVAGQAVTLKVGTESRSGKTDAQGRAQFDGLGAGALVQATTTVDGETLTSKEFAVPGQGGVRVALIAGIAAAAAKEKSEAEAAANMPARPGVVEIGPESRIIIEYQDDNLTVFYLLEVMNNARTPIDIGGPLLIRLPTGAAGASVMQGSSTHASAKGDMLTITGPFPPGKTVAQVGFSLPQAGENYTLRQTWPAAVAQVFVGMEKIGDMKIASPQLTDIRDMNSDGQPFVMATGGRLNAGDTLVLNLTGLPAHSNTSRNAVLIAALVIFAAGGWFAFAPAKARAAQDTKLHARREKLMTEVVALERKRRNKALSETDEARLERVTAELERVIAELDRGAAA
ncbi:MAG TPA: hypothetical protein VM096_15430 [Vicinamibacterales bacterium]|nr:hypothetical protein [Vicinamibacterales bacterium]